MGKLFMTPKNGVKVIVIHPGEGEFDTTSGFVIHNDFWTGEIAHLLYQAQEKTNEKYKLKYPGGDRLILVSTKTPQEEKTDDG